MTITAASARRILRRQGMPRREIRAVLGAHDPLVVRRFLELHRERLEEWLEEQQRLLANIEREPPAWTEVPTSSMPIDTPC